MNWEIYIVFAIVLTFIFVMYAIKDLSKKFYTLVDAIALLSKIVESMQKESDKHDKFNSMCHQYNLICVRMNLIGFRNQMIKEEQYEHIKDIEQTIKEIENLIQTKIND